MTFTRLAAVIASFALAITTVQLYAETEVEADFQDAVIQDSIVETTAKTIKKGEGAQGGVIILNTNSNANQNDSQAYASNEADVEADLDSDVSVRSEALSQADSMRNARKSAEVSTEQRIVEKLEASRLEDERRRADVLFGDRFEALEKKEVIKKKTQIDDDYGYDDEIIEKKVIVQKVIEKEEVPVVVAPVQTQTVAVQPPEHLRNDRTYMGFSLGGMSYDADNVESNYAAGVIIGRDLGNRVNVEGSFLYSNHYVDTFWVAPVYSEVSQYDIGLTARYSILTGALKPFVGAGVNYVYRNYQDRIYGATNQYGWNAYNTNDEFGGEANTHAVDGSLLAGLDLELSRNFVIGAEFKYSTNVFVKNDEPVFAQKWAQPTFGKPLEEIDRSQVTVNAKFMF